MISTKAYAPLPILFLLLLADVNAESVSDYRIDSAECAVITTAAEPSNRHSGRLMAMTGHVEPTDRWSVAGDDLYQDFNWMLPGYTTAPHRGHIVARVPEEIYADELVAGEESFSQLAGMLIGSGGTPATIHGQDYLKALRNLGKRSQ